MAATYPAGTKSFTDVTDAMYAQASMWNEAYDEIEAIEAELGINPAGDFTTVVERLDKIWCFQATAGEALSDRDYVYVGASGYLYKCDADTESKSKSAAVCGFVLGAVSLGATATVQFNGKVTGLSSLTAGSVYYISQTAGAITVTAPTAPAFSVAVGTAVSSTTLFINPVDQNLNSIYDELLMLSIVL